MNHKTKAMSLIKTSKSNDSDEFDNQNNGLVFQNTWIPEEILTEILLLVDHKSLLQCQLVCKRWLFLIQSYVLRKKAENVTGNPPRPVDGQSLWIIYYFICDRIFRKNLIQHRKCIKPYWHIIENGGNKWKIELTPDGALPYPKDSIFERRRFCYVTSSNRCWKKKTINLIKEGYSEYLLDNIQPIVKISEWYCSRIDCPAKYSCRIEMLDGSRNLLDYLNFSRYIDGSDLGKWFKFEHEFKNYGKGLRLIRFYHGGSDGRYQFGHYGSKMGGTQITLDIPREHYNYNYKDEEEIDEDKSLSGSEEGTENETEIESVEDSEDEDYTSYDSEEDTDNYSDEDTEEDDSDEMETEDESNEDEFEMDEDEDESEKLDETDWSDKEENEEILSHIKDLFVDVD